jgi:oligo-1,6-glucosidase
LIEVLARWQDGLGDTGWSGLYWGNHDQPRAVSRFGDVGRFRVESATMLAAVLYLLRGTPFVYQGEEIGMSDPQSWSLDQIRDVSARNHIRDGLADGRSVDELLAEVAVAGRDNGRTPMRWTGGTHGGFSTVEPWIRQTDDPPWVSVEAQRDDPDSVLALHRRLFALRRAEPALGGGTFRRVLPGVSQLFAYERRLGDRCVLVVGRWSSDDVAIDDDALAPWDGAELLLGNHTEPALVTGNRLALRPWEVVVLRRVGVR